jgi:hypothetical protein
MDRTTDCDAARDEGNRSQDKERHEDLEPLCEAEIEVPRIANQVIDEPAEGEPDGKANKNRQNAEGPARPELEQLRERDHGPFAGTVNTPPSLRPFTPGLYISSAYTGGADVTAERIYGCHAGPNSSQTFCEMSIGFEPSAFMT